MHELIARHVVLTGSAVGAGVLERLAASCSSAVRGGDAARLQARARRSRGAAGQRMRRRSGNLVGA